MHGRTTGARTAVLCALLLGLFLMHGSPASAADGCHTDRRTGVPAVAAHPHGSAVRAAGGPAVRAPQPYGTGGHCVSTQARGGAPLPAPGPAPLCGDGAAAGPDGPGAAPTAGESGRAPPDGGRGLLLKVCVARR
ncbi:hypothetical protein [Kitasatospora arboriphila]|uniref:Secreted protein n=1 Tax=Kitasatospora arboriphila TaxID=258052 RepID=A0ABN1TI33_9ACTN